MQYLVFAVRYVVIGLYLWLLTAVAFVACLFAPKAKGNMSKISKFVHPILRPLYGLKPKIIQEVNELPDSAVYITNHQNTMDIVVFTKAIQPNTVTVGKRELAFIPFFGWMYWIAGNILIQKNIASKAYRTIQYVVAQIKAQRLCIWMYPEGTRSYGRYELGQFKPGAFITAIEAQVPIVPVVVSNLNNYHLGKVDNGYVIIKYLEPINTKGMTRSQAKDLAAQVHANFLAEYRKLNEIITSPDVAQLADNYNFSIIKTEEWMAKNKAYELSSASQAHEYDK